MTAWIYFLSNLICKEWILLFLPGFWVQAASRANPKSHFIFYSLFLIMEAEFPPLFHLKMAPIPELVWEFCRSVGSTQLLLGRNKKFIANLSLIIFERKRFFSSHILLKSWINLFKVASVKSVPVKICFLGKLKNVSHSLRL